MWLEYRWNNKPKSFEKCIFSSKKKLIILMEIHHSENTLLSFENASIYMCLIFVYKMLCFHNYLAWFIFYANPNFCTRFSNMRNLCVLYIKTSHTRQSLDYLNSVIWIFMAFFTDTKINLFQARPV